MEAPMFWIKLTDQEGNDYQLNRVACTPIGAIDPFTGEVVKPLLWFSRRGAERIAEKLRTYSAWSRVEIVEKLS